MEILPSPDYTDVQRRAENEGHRDIRISPESIDMEFSVIHDICNGGLDAGMGASSPKHAAELKQYVDRCGARGLACGLAPCGFWMVSQENGADFAMVLDFCAVFGGGRSLLAPPTWENAGAARRFGPSRPAKPPRSCKWGSLASEVAHLDTCSDSVSAGRRSRMGKRLKPTGVRAISRKLV